VRPDFESADHLADDRDHLLTHGLRAYTASGVVGRPSLASADKGRVVLETLVARFAGTLAVL
jgi:creatinine amidohydrolase